MSRWSLEFEAGGQLGLRRGVTLVGRSSACDIVLDDAAVSRRQLLLHTRLDGVELICVGRQVVTCNDEAIADGALAQSGDHLAIGGSSFATVRERREELPRRWSLRLRGGPRVRISRTPFVLGSGREDDLRIEGLSPAAVRLHEVDAGLVAEIDERALSLLRDHEAAQFDADGFARLGVAQRLEIAGVELALVADDPSVEPSTWLGEGGGPTTIRLEPYARGGVLTVGVGEDARSVYLAERRFALIHALICPPIPAKPGDFLSVDELCRAVWPGDSHKDETDFNVLLYRVRRGLLDAGFDVNKVIERVRGTGMVRAPIAVGARVLIE